MIYLNNILKPSHCKKSKDFELNAKRSTQQNFEKSLKSFKLRLMFGYFQLQPQPNTETLFTATIVSASHLHPLICVLHHAHHVSIPPVFTLLCPFPRRALVRGCNSHVVTLGFSLGTAQCLICSWFNYLYWSCF